MFRLFDPCLNCCVTFGYPTRTIDLKKMIKVYIPRCKELVFTSSEHDKSAKCIDGRFAKCSEFLDKQPILSSLKSHDPTEGLKAMDNLYEDGLRKCEQCEEESLNDVYSKILGWLLTKRLWISIAEITRPFQGSISDDRDNMDNLYEDGLRKCEQCEEESLNDVYRILGWLLTKRLWISIAEITRPFQGSTSDDRDNMINEEKETR
ncbi:hypothetical protein CASFOL_028716 [Castilleja foliolosa]|uniref:Uncharacterized protein n=1 Tax=Castilleja foliolosa TaxID=1961234 RepID=A0ABD3CC26_9LAMI